MTDKKKIAVIGGGSWGSALACTFARITGDCLLYTKNTQTAHEINTQHTNSKYLPGTEIDQGVRATVNFADIVQHDFIVIAIPSHSFCGVIEKLKQHNINSKTTLLVASKGMCSEPSQLFSDYLEQNFSNNFAFIHGPNFAKEMAEGRPASITIAARDDKIRGRVADLLVSDQLEIEQTNDIITVQIASMAKNIFAIKSGIMRARGDGENIKAALISQALKEISALSVHLGGEYKSMSLASVVGDLVLTCYSPTSRNNRFGYELHQSNYSPSFLHDYPLLVEGANSARFLNEFASKLGVDLPTIREVAKLCHYSGV